MNNNFSTKFKKFDIFVIAFAVVLIVASLITTNILFLRKSNQERIVQIYVQNELVTSDQIKIDELTEEKVIVLKKDDHPTLLGDMIILVDKEKGICISDVTCPNHTCEKQGWVNRVGVPIVCIPNGVYVIINSSELDHDIILG